jgi:Ca2+-transporting ATPase
MNWHLIPIEEVAALLKTTPSGVHEKKVLELLKKFGHNKIQKTRKQTVLKMLWHQLSNFMILILIAVAILSRFIGEATDTYIILAIVFLNAIVGFVQEYRAEKAIAALKNMVPSLARVVRQGNTMEIPTVTLVPGDVVILEAGNSVPADVRFFETHQLKVDESTLTGESLNVLKHSQVLPKADYPLGEQVNMGFKGTYITNGRGTAYVVATGMNTQLGGIAKMIQTAKSISPLQKKLNIFGKRLSFIILLLCIIIFAIGYLNGENPLSMLLITTSLAVAAIPEALPALVTVALALGAKGLAIKKALIRNLTAVETLGSVTYICSDKTGTLTQNKMVVSEIYTVPPTADEFTNVPENLLLKAMALNNDVSQDANAKWLGDSTEVAMVQYAFENYFDKERLEKINPRIAEFPFDASKRCMTTIHQTENGILVITKGAVDVLLKKTRDNQLHLFPAIKEKDHQMAYKGYRVLGFAIKELKIMPEVLNRDKIESSLTFIGMVAMIDPPRIEAKEAIRECKMAGIIPVMITGDHKITALAIAKQLGIVTNDNDRVLSGNELVKLSSDKFEDIVEKIRVYARVNPEQKLKIIQTLKKKGQQVALLGDGVNDAAALKEADIGIAMGISGTEVAKEASDMILLDDNYATVIIAIKHGRVIFDNILKFIKYILTGNFGEIIAIFLAPFFGLPIPLLAIHILWINLVTDGLPGLALASEGAESNIMQRPPRNPNQTIFKGRLALHILWVGFLMGGVTLAIQYWAIERENTHWQTMAFTVLCFSQMGHVLSIRSARESLFSIGIFSNKFLIGALALTVLFQFAIIYIPFFNAVFKTQPLSIVEVGITIAVSSVVFWAVELEKYLYRLKT